MSNEYFVYIMMNKTGQPYIGVTNSLERRVWEHKSRISQSYTARYHMDRLVYWEEYPRVDEAIAREKQLKNWGRSKKMWLIQRQNPDLIDLSITMFESVDDSGGVISE